MFLKTNPIALVSTNNSSKFLIMDWKYNKETLTIDGQAIDFYYGNVIINIKGDFNDFEIVYVLHMKIQQPVLQKLIYIILIIVIMKALYILYYLTIVCMDFDNCMKIKLVNNKFQILLNGDTNYDSTEYTDLILDYINYRM